MRRGCISLGNISCDKCHRTIPYPERYLSLEDAPGKNQTLCMDCSHEHGFVKAGADKKESDAFFDLSTD